jgi:ABC-type branched-subunit amino acid transport system substrate-binding protein
MAKRLPGRRAALAGVLVAALTTMGVSQCGGTSSSSTVTVSGKTLTIYASAPQNSAQATDVLDAEQLALRQLGSRVSGFTIRFVALHAKPSANARTAIQDKTAIAYLGELEPGVSADTMGITNAQDLLQVSPTDTALELTRSTPAVPGAPGDYYEAHGTYGNTFGRVVPSSAAEARAQVAMMGSLSVKKLYVADDGTPYGEAISYAVRRDASGAGISVTTGPLTASAVSSAGSDALFFGASAGAPGTATMLASAAGNAKLFVPSALASAPLPSGTYVSQPGFLPKDVPALGQSQFVKPFKYRYGHAPGTEAIFGYEAMAAVLSVLSRAGSHANDRTTVVRDFFAIHNRRSVLGTYSIDSHGDPSIAPFVFSRFQGGAPVLWRAAP